MTANAITKSLYFSQGLGSHPSPPICQSRSRNPQRSPSTCPNWFADDSTRRRNLVSWLDKVCHLHQFSSRTLCLTVALLDHLPAPLGDSHDDICLTALLSLFLASKLTEPQSKFLNPTQIWRFLQGRVSGVQILRQEQTIFLQLGCNVNRVTAFDFLSEFLTQGFITDAELAAATDPRDLDYALERLEVHMLHVTFELLKLPAAARLPADVLAAAVICHERSLIGLEPWSRHLESVTGLSHDDLKDCLAIFGELDLQDAGRALKSEYNVLTREYENKTKLRGIVLTGFPADYQMSPSRKSSCYGVSDCLDSLASPDHRETQPTGYRARRSDSFTSGQLPDEEESEGTGPTLKKVKAN